MEKRKLRECVDASNVRYSRSHRRVAVWPFEARIVISLSMCCRTIYWVSVCGAASPAHEGEQHVLRARATDFQGSVIDALREAIEGQIPNSRAEINGGGGHFNIEVTSPVFTGKGMLESQRLVYSAIAHMMKGDRAPVHAVDSLKTRTPE